VITALALFVGGVAVGYLVSRWREDCFWHRLFVREFTRPQMSTTPPTVAEVGRPIWLTGPCPICDDGPFTELAFAEHMRARHGDS
jgi:hypothetical protein